MDDNPSLEVFGWCTTRFGRRLPCQISSSPLLSPVGEWDFGLEGSPLDC